MKTLNATRGKVIIKEEGGGKQTTEHGIIYEEKKKNTEGTGIVHGVGEPEIAKSGKPIPFDVEVGQKVLFTKRNGYSSYGGYIIVNHADVYGVFGE